MIDDTEFCGCVLSTEEWKKFNNKTGGRIASTLAELVRRVNDGEIPLESIYQD